MVNPDQLTPEACGLSDDYQWAHPPRQSVQLLLPHTGELKYGGPQRLLSGRVLGFPRPPADVMRYMSSQINDRAGNTTLVHHAPPQRNHPVAALGLRDDTRFGAPLIGTEALRGPYDDETSFRTDDGSIYLVIGSLAIYDVGPCARITVVTANPKFDSDKAKELLARPTWEQDGRWFGVRNHRSTLPRFEAADYDPATIIEQLFAEAPPQELHITAVGGAVLALSHDIVVRND